MNNVGLTDLSALGGVSRLTSLELNECSVLSSLHGLEQVTRIDGPLRITKNPALADAHGLQALESVRSLIVIEFDVDDALTAVVSGD